MQKKRIVLVSVIMLMAVVSMGVFCTRIAKASNEDTIRFEKVSKYQGISDSNDNYLDDVFDEGYIKISEDAIDKIEEEQDKLEKNTKVCYMRESVNNIDTKYSADTCYNILKKYDDEYSSKFLSLYNDIKNLVSNFYQSNKNIEATRVDDYTIRRNNEMIYPIGKVNYSKYDIHVDDAMEIYYALKDDMPYYYFLSCSIYYSNSELIIITDKDYVKYTDRYAYYDKIDSKIKEYEQMASNFSKTYEKVLSVHDKIIREVDYTEGEDERSNKFFESSHNIVGVLGKDNGSAVCQGYALAAALVLKDIGVECLYVPGIGVTGRTRGAHAWNEVKLDDGKWYGMDITWDDSPQYTGNNKGGIIYNYYGCNNASFSKDHQKDRDELVTEYLPEITSNECPYAYNNITKSTGKIQKDGIEYEYSGMYARIVGYSGNDKNIVIPSIVNDPNSSSNKMVIGIEQKAIYGDKTLENIVLPETLIYISGASDYSKGSVAECTNLKNVVLDNYLNYLGDYSFANCTQLSYVNLPQKLVNYNKSLAFYNCTSFKDFSKEVSTSIPQNVIEKNDNNKENDNKKDDNTINNGNVTSDKKDDSDSNTTNESENNKKKDDVTSSVVTGISLSKRTVNSLTLKWKALSGVDGYKIERYNSSKKKYVLIKTVTKNTYTDTKLSSATVYKYRIQAYKGTKKGKYSSVYTNITTPRVPKKLKLVSKTKKKINVSVTKADNPTYYEVYRKCGANGKYKLVKKLTLKALSYTDSKLSSGKYYYYKVRAYKASGSIKVYSGYVSLKIKCK